LSADARLFIAVDPPAPVQARLAAWARRAIMPDESADRQRGPADGIRKVDAAALHITLCFLGDQPLDAVEEIGDVMRESVRGLAAAGMPVGPLGIGAPVWLPARRPRALALEVHDESGGLVALYEDLRRGLGAAIGWVPERRRLRPHITVARLRAWAPPPACREPSPPLVFDPEWVTLYRSRLESGGAVYRALARTGP
jgi:2'-5' RNA ligase